MKAKQELLQRKVEGREVKLNAHKQRLVATETDQADMRRDVNKALGAVKRAEEKASAGGSNATFVARSFETKGGCNFGAADTEGFDQSYADSLLTKVKAALPPALREAIGSHTLKGLGNGGSRAAIITVSVTKPEVLNELLRLLSRLLKDCPDLAYQCGDFTKTLYVTPERSEADRARYRSMGRVKDKVEKIRARTGAVATGELSVKWKPRFAVIDEESDEVIISVRLDGTLHIDEASSLQFFGLSVRELTRELAGSF